MPSQLRAGSRRGDLPPAVDPAQLDLTARDEAEEQDERRVFRGQGALRLHASSEFLVKALNRVGGPQCLPLRSWEASRRPFPGTGEQRGTRQPERDRSCRSRERARPGAIAVATSDWIALPRTRPECCPQLFVHGRLDRDTNMLVNQLAQRGRVKLLRSRSFPDTLRHGAFLRWPPARAAGWSSTSSTGRMRHFSFSTSIGTPPGNPKDLRSLRLAASLPIPSSGYTDLCIPIFPVSITGRERQRPR